MANEGLDIEQTEIIIVRNNTICRLCASQNDKLIGIYSQEGISNGLSNLINLYLPIKVDTLDELPLQCCWNCASTLLAWHDLVTKCVSIDKKFRSLEIVTEKGPEEEVFDNPVTTLSDDDNDACDNEGSKDEDRGVCTICHKTISRARDLKRHMSNCHSDSTAPHLGPKKHTEEKQKRHRRKNCEISPAFFCDVCEKGFTRKHDMEKHKTRAHEFQKTRRGNLEVLERCRNKGPGGKVFYKCDVCQRNFAQSYNLMRHRTIHTGVKDYFCHLCGKSFRMSNGLNRHIDTCHNGKKNYSCDVCKKMFSARATRDEHMNIHTNNRPFVCDVCGKSFKQKASLHVHKMFHSDLYRFECSNCGKKFRRNQDLKVHGWLHTGHRPHACDKCKATFRLRHDLTRHLRIHDKLNECACNVCGSVFSQERYLKVHKRIHVETIVKIEDPLKLK